MEQIDLISIFKSQSTILTFKEIFLAISCKDKPTLLMQRLNHYAKKGLLYSCRRGLYAKNKNYCLRSVHMRLKTSVFGLHVTIVSHRRKAL